MNKKKIMASYDENDFLPYHYVSMGGQVVLKRLCVEDICDALASGEHKRVVILSGAGVSTNAGIPDYRSPGGLYSRGIDAESLFDASKLGKTPESAELVRQIDEAEHTEAHTLAVFLHALGLLECVITQNIDGLYQRAGLPEDRVIEFHGSSERGNVVAYGDAIDVKVAKDSRAAMEAADMVLVMGTSLQVAPFCALPNILRKEGYRVLVDIDPENAFDNAWTGSAYRRSNAGMVVSSWMKFAGRKVTLRSSFGHSYSKRYRKWRKQDVFAADCDEFAEALMRGLVERLI